MSHHIADTDTAGTIRVVATDVAKGDTIEWNGTAYTVFFFGDGLVGARSAKGQTVIADYVAPVAV